MFGFRRVFFADLYIFCPKTPWTGFHFNEAMGEATP
jgi:hypothetical protein